MRRLALLSGAALATLTAVSVLWELRHAVIVLLLSLAAASAIAPIVERGTARGIPRPLALALSYGVALGVPALALGPLVGPLLADVRGTSDELAVAYREAKTRWAAGSSIEQAIAAHLPTADLAGALGDSNPSGFAQGLVGVAVDAVAFAGELVVILILSVFWSANVQGFERLWVSLLPVDRRAGVREAWEAIKSGVGEQVRNDIVQSLLAVVLLVAGFHAMGLAHPTLPAAAEGVLRLVPVVGVVLAALTTVLSGITTSPLLAVLAAIYMLAVLLLLETVVAPRLLRSRRYSSLLVTLLAITLTDAYGLTGLLVAPAAAAGLQIAFEKLLAELDSEAVVPVTFAQLDERVALLRRQLEERGPGASPELVSVVERLSHLLASAEGATP